ncbi:protein FAM228B [Protobothrops mucrosquamatus]|uniref:protein FAM228B n=1 Tax=Protobothrops mucrosquamatus TaxID=103944 RepID=UPI000775F450|nr:protein FAM228B [Protobothrops mucrosquamatus]
MEEILMRFADDTNCFLQEQKNKIQNVIGESNRMKLDKRLKGEPYSIFVTEVTIRADSLSSENSESSGEDWLIKVCCPGARHRYSKRAHAKKSISSRSTKTGDSSILDKKDDFTEKTELTPTTSYQDYTRVPRQESTDLEWLVRLRCPRAEMEQLMPDLKQSFPGVTRFLSKSQSKVCGASQSEKTKTSESWLTQKHLSIAQALVNESQDVIGPIQLLLEKESCFIREVDRYLKHNDFLALRRREMLYKKWFESVSRPLLQKIQDKVDNQSSKEIEERKRKQLSLYLNYCNEKGGAFLESYSPSSYDPFFLKTSPDLWKASVPPLHDPLLKEVEGRYIEASIMQQCETGKVYSSKDVHELHKTELPPLPLGRQLMNPIEWLKIPFQYMESDVRQKSRKAHMRARKGKEQEKARKKEINFLPRGSTTRKARNLLSGSKQEMIWV